MKTRQLIVQCEGGLHLRVAAEEDEPRECLGEGRGRQEGADPPEPGLRGEDRGAEHPQERDRGGDDCDGRVGDDQPLAEKTAGVLVEPVGGRGGRAGLVGSRGGRGGGREHGRGGGRAPEAPR